ncbi:MAG: imidazolonepropionase [Armatimonadota bacterium]
MDNLPPNLLIVNAAQVVTPAKEWNLKVIKNGAVAVRDGKIVDIGRTGDVIYRVEPGAETLIIDAAGKIVMPGFVDPHTHLVYAGSRAEEFTLRLQGVPYMEIASRGGGINSTVKATRKASLDDLVDSAKARLARMFAWGTTTAEVKSGYALNHAGELKMLMTIQQLALEQPVELVPTYMGAHEFPPEYQEKRGEYVDLLVKTLIPEIGKKWLAEFCDVFTEKGVFSVDDSRRILEAAKEAGLMLKIHADEIVHLGGAELAAEVGAVSADHLVHVSPEGMDAMKRAGVVPVILPGASFFLNSDFAPARAMIERGLPVALGTDLNPGTCTIESMPIIIGLACLKLKLTPEEAIIASTLNAAKAIRRDSIIGSLEVGKQADMLIMKISDYREIPYRFGVNPVDMVIKKGKLVRQ